ncbi:aldo/keto reductase [Pelagicoccus mobilis]|uniref:Aldo/keto reductase n=1 Tax=Pelagicoccus mobilis TaxID=415221 RepID=A0A934RRJ2_9BACT|nr:aldo/keto reductase [Pelagicoccus mobilis]MBK1875582.1 aldo/keto reductase [Pelagicoccus mobilis]
MKRKIAGLDLECSALGFGAWAIGGPFWQDQQPLGWGEVDDAESEAALREAIAGGVDFIDTADLYGAGHSEKVIGRVLADTREDIVVSTKCGFCFDEATKQVTGSSSAPEYIRAACQASLKRLGLDRIDLYFLHVPELEGAERVDAFAALGSLVDEGLIRSFGWSTDSVEMASWASELEGCVAIQYERNVLRANPEMDALCESMGLAGVNRSPLAMGMLSRKSIEGRTLSESDIRSKAPEWLSYFENGRPKPEFLSKLLAVREILCSEGRTESQGALAWLWATSEASIPIPGIRTVEQAQSASEAMRLGPLSPSQVEEIRSILKTS